MNDVVELAAKVADLVVARLEPRPWLDKRGIAEHFSCSTRSIEQAMAEGMPYAVAFGRPKFRPAECEAWATATGRLELAGDRGNLSEAHKCPRDAGTSGGRTSGGTPDAST